MTNLNTSSSTNIEQQDDFNLLLNSEYLLNLAVAFAAIKLVPLQGDNPVVGAAKNSLPESVIKAIEARPEQILKLLVNQS